MTGLPQDPLMLLSVVNTKLRDLYSSLDALCDDLHTHRSSLEAVLQTVGYSYDAEQNAFVPHA